MVTTNPRTLWRVLFALFALTLFITFNIVHFSNRSGRQLEFDSWLGQIEQSQNDTQVFSVPVTLSLSSDGSSSWELRSGSAEQNEQIVRILQLAREARLFEGGSLSASTAGIQFLVKSGEREFRAALKEDAVEQNLQARNLLKLFEIYSTNHTSHG